MDEHRTEARISIQALVGKIRLHLPEREPLELSAGQLLALDCGMPHDVEWDPLESTCRHASLSIL